MLTSPRRACGWHGRPTRQRGMSLVELMVGITVGLFVAAAASMLAAMQLGENRRMLQEAQLLQDLRASTDLMGRELRRSGATGEERIVWLPGAAGVALFDPPWDAVSPTAGAAAQIDFTYRRPHADSGQLGYKLEGDRLKTLIPGFEQIGRAVRNQIGWQDLTDPRTVEVTRFSVTPVMVDEPTPAAPAPSRLPCPRLCADGTTDCWPTVRVRQYRIDITGRTLDGTSQRTMSTTVRLRNNELRRNPSVVNPIPAGSVCPA